jgi:hypothetical protein
MPESEQFCRNLGWSDSGILAGIAGIWPFWPDATDRPFWLDLSCQPAVLAGMFWQIRPADRNTVAGIWADRIPATMAGFCRQIPATLPECCRISVPARFC